MIKKTFLAIGLSLTLVTGIYQAALAQGAVLEVKSVGTSTVPRDEICTMTNGNRIPCEFLAAAEKDIVSGGKVVDQTSGQEFCRAEGKYFPCDALKPDGSTTAAYQLKQYTIVLISMIFRYWLYVASALVAVVIVVLIFRKLLKK